jgi:hypothetical protein
MKTHHRKWTPRTLRWKTCRSSHRFAQFARILSQRLVAWIAQRARHQGNHGPSSHERCDDASDESSTPNLSLSGTITTPRRSRTDSSLTPKDPAMRPGPYTVDEAPLSVMHNPTVVSLTHQREPKCHHSFIGIPRFPDIRKSTFFFAALIGVIPVSVRISRSFLFVRVGWTWRIMTPNNSKATQSLDSSQPHARALDVDHPARFVPLVTPRARQGVPRGRPRARCGAIRDTREV